MSLHLLIARLCKLTKLFALKISATLDLVGKTPTNYVIHAIQHQPIALHAVSLQTHKFAPLAKPHTSLTPTNASQYAHPQPLAPNPGQTQLANHATLSALTTSMKTLVSLNAQMAQFKTHQTTNAMLF